MDLETTWKGCLEDIRERIPEQAYHTWFDGVTLKSLDADAVVLTVPGKFHREWLESKYTDLIRGSIKKQTGKSPTIEYMIESASTEGEDLPTMTPKPKIPEKGYHNQTKLNRRYTFDNFIEGKSNQLAKAAAGSVAENPGQTPFNPLLIYSGTGLGKTHLLQAIGNYTAEHNPATKVVYLTSEKFMLDFINAIQVNRSTEFAGMYRNVDLLLLDDIQFFQNKEQTQEQFFHLFNDLYQQGKQIVLSTDRPPSELTGLKDRLVSRFQSGLMVDIQAPDLETRIAILMKKGEDDGLEIPFDITAYIASGVKNNIRELEGALIRLLAFSTLRKQSITMDLAQKVLQDILGKSAFTQVTIDHVIKYVSREMRVSERQLLGKSRIMEIALARQVGMYLSRELTSSSLINIGYHLGRRDHTTVIHACRTIEKKMKNDPEFNRRVDKMKSELDPSGHFAEQNS